MSTKTDITTLDDCRGFVKVFYQKLLADPNIRHHFLNLDLEPHLEIVANFWSTILLGTQSYKNNTVAAHSHLKLKKEDFTIWQGHFENTIKSLFEGPKAEEAIQRAKHIGFTMQFKLLDEYKNKE